MEWRTLGIIRVLYSVKAMGMWRVGAWMEEHESGELCWFFFFFFFWLRNDDRLKYWITEDGVRGWTRDGSLEEVYSCSSLFHDLKGNEFKIRGFETVSFHRYRYKGWKISFRLRSIHAPFCTHTHRERSNKDTSNGARRAPKGDDSETILFFSIEKNINISRIRFQKSVHTLIQ